MSRFYKRVIRVNIESAAGGYTWSTEDGLKIGFDCEHGAKKRPNKAKLRLTNLSRESVEFLEQRDLQVGVVAGYLEGQTSLVISGKITASSTKWGATDTVTELLIKDGISFYREGRFKRSYRSGVTTRQVLIDMLRASGLGLGYGVNEVPDVEYTEPVVFSGTLRSGLDRVLSDAGGYQWSIQDNQLQVLADGASATGQQDLLITPTSGLIGSPRQKGKGIELETLLIGDLRPGRQIVVETERIRAGYVVRSCKHKGEAPRGGDFRTSIKARLLDVRI